MTSLLLKRVSSNANTIVAYPYVILKGGGKWDRVQGDSSSRVGGTAINIRGKITSFI